MADADPVAAPDAYRALLLGALGADDPAVVQAETPARVASLIREAGPRLRIRPAPDEWSVIECLGHLVDGEHVVSGRSRWILAEDEPDIVGYDQDAGSPASTGTTTRSRSWPSSPRCARPTFGSGRRAPTMTARGSGSIANAARRAMS